MVAQSLWNVILPGKLAIISQRLQLSQLYSIGKRGKEQERKRRAWEPGQWIHEFIKGGGREVSGERERPGGREEDRERGTEMESGPDCQWYANMTFTLEETTSPNQKKTKKMVKRLYLSVCILIIYQSLYYYFAWLPKNYRLTWKQVVVECYAALFPHIVILLLSRLCIDCP